LQLLSRSCLYSCVCSAFHFVAPLKPLHSPPGIYHSALPGEKGMALTAQLNLKELLGGAGGKGITAGTNYLGVGIILGMNLILHNIQLA